VHFGRAVAGGFESSHNPIGRAPLAVSASPQWGSVELRASAASSSVRFDSAREVARQFRDFAAIVISPRHMGFLHHRIFLSALSGAPHPPQIHRPSVGPAAAQSAAEVEAEWALEH
jgi:hypothetical protein